MNKKYPFNINIHKAWVKLFLIIITLSNVVFAQVDYEKYFLDNQMRLDYYHMGNADSEYFSFDEVISEPYWGGSKVNLIDTLNLGNYMFCVYSLTDDNKIYSRGYSSLFQEWQSTDEAKKIDRTFSETLIFPYPKDSVRIELHRRDRNNEFVKAYQFIIDPHNYTIKEDKRIESDFEKIHYSGKSNIKLDIVFLPDGYTINEEKKFLADCKKFSEYLFEYEPFDSLKEKINVWSVKAFSEDSGIDIPKDTIWKNTILNTSFYIFNSERYVMTMDNKSVRDAASNVPYDQIYILVNSSKYGGGAIYNYYSTAVVDNPRSKQIFIHEFGHGLAGLADEYAGDVTYNNFYPLDVEPWEKNITTLVNFGSKWEKMLNPTVEIPTPLNKKSPLELGVYEGAGYVSKGVYRPSTNSLMRAFDSNEFNEVSKRAIEQVIQFYAN